MTQSETTSAAGGGGPLSVAEWLAAQRREARDQASKSAREFHMYSYEWYAGQAEAYEAAHAYAVARPLVAPAAKGGTELHKIIEAADCIGVRGATWALTIEWPDGSETIEHVSDHGALALGYSTPDDAPSPPPPAGAAGGGSGDLGAFVARDPAPHAAPSAVTDFRTINPGYSSYDGTWHGPAPVLPPTPDLGAQGEPLRLLQAWIEHWQADVAAGLTPTPESLEKAKAVITKVLGGSNA